MIRFSLIVALSALTTFWMGNVGVYLLLLWCLCVSFYTLGRAR
jgi:hypothetical protein